METKLPRTIVIQTSVIRRLVEVKRNQLKTADTMLRDGQQGHEARQMNENLGLYRMVVAVVIPVVGSAGVEAGKTAAGLVSAMLEEPSSRCRRARRTSTDL